MRFFTIFVLLLAALAGGGYWNYQRNAAREREQEKRSRPYRSLSDKDLKALREGYRAELEPLKQKVDMYSRAAKSSAEAGGPDLQAKVQALGRTQARAEQMRGAQLETRENEVELERIEREFQVRGSGRDEPWTRFRRLLLTFSFDSAPPPE